MRAALPLLAAVLICALPSSAPASLGDYAVFTPGRDWSNGTGTSDYWNTGLCPAAPAYRWDWGECLLLDWDQQADNILQWMADHPLAEGQRYQFELSLVTAMGWLACGLEPIPGPQRLEVRTLNMATDWAEGDYDCIGAGCYPPMLCWTPETFAAVNVYAQCYWYFDNWIAKVDIDKSVPWTTHEGTVVPTFQGHPELFRHVNSRHLVVQTTAGGFQDVGTRVSVVLDYDPDHAAGSFPMPAINDLLYNERNRGLILGRRQYWDEPTGSWVGNESWYGAFFTKDAWEPAHWPELIVSIAGAPPQPGDADLDGKVDGGDYCVWADHYRDQPVLTWSAGGWSVANFTEDYVVDGGDYTVWADNYGFNGGIPEPGVLALLALPAALLTRRSRRPACRPAQPPMDD